MGSERNVIFMKKLILLFFVVIYSCGETPVINFNKEKEFFRESGVFLYYKGNPFSGTIEVYYDNGQLFKKVTYKEGNRDRKGVYEEYYKNGKLVELDEFGYPIINYEMDSDNLQIINGKLYRNKRLFSGILNSSFKKDNGIFEYNGVISKGQPQGIPMRTTLDVNNPQMFFYKTKNGYKFDEGWKNFLNLIKQKNDSVKEKTILLKELFLDLDDSGNKRKIGELKFNPEKNEVTLQTLMDNKPFSGKVLKNKIVSHFSEYIDSSNKIRYDLDGEFIVYHDNGIVQYKGEYLRGTLDGSFLSYNNKGELVVPLKKSSSKNNKLNNCESSVRFHIQNLNKIIQYVEYNGSFYFGEFFDPQYGKNFFFKIYLDSDCNVINVDIN